MGILSPLAWEVLKSWPGIHPVLTLALIAVILVLLAGLVIALVMGARVNWILRNWWR